MGRYVLHGNPPLEVKLRRSARARRLSLRVSRLDGAVTLTLPRGVAEAQGIAFAEERADWVRAQVAQVGPSAEVSIGGMLPFAGVAHEIVRGHGRAVRVADGRIELPATATMPGKTLRGFLRARARDALAEASDRHAARLGVSYAALALRDTRSRWGSCSSDRRLMYSWRLVMAPPAVLDYVAAHEVSHLREMNHSAAFWQTVGELMPDYAAHRAWLRTEGDALLRIRFGD